MTKKDRLTAKRILIAGGLLALWSILIVWRLADLQVLRHEEFKEKALGQQELIKKIPAVRGSIFDRNGALLAVTRKSDTITIEPDKVTNPYRTAGVLNRILGIERRKILHTCRREDQESIFIKRMVPTETSNRIRALNLPGVGFTPENDRHYPQADLACHLLGFTNMEDKGCYGVELMFNSHILGEPGEWPIHRDAKGNTYGKKKPPITTGDDLVLSIDEVIQFHTERALEAAMKTSRASAGTVVVMDVWDGDILAMASRPCFDPNHYNRSDPVARLNRATHQIYEPGSTFKLVTMAAALEAGTLDLQRTIDCEQGKLWVDGGWIHDHKPFGELTPAEIIAQSSNVGAMKIGQGVGSEGLFQMIRAFGFGQKTGVQLEKEEPGLVKPVVEWSGRSCATISFGQEISVTPLQLCRAVAAMASDGQLRVPRLVLRKLDRKEGTIEHYPPVIESRAVSEATAAELRNMMSGVVEYGTGSLAGSGHYSSAGKTGTAQKIIDRKYSDTLYIASFAGFAPLEQPRIAVVVVFDDVRRPNHHGGQVAAPVFRQVVDHALRRLGLPSSQDVVLTARAGGTAAEKQPDPASAG